MFWRRALVPFAAVAIGYIAFPIALFVASLLEGDTWRIENELYAGEVTLAWSVVALGAVAVNCTALAYVARSLHWWLRIVVVVLNLPLVAGVGGALFLSTMGFQNYAAGYAAYETAEHVCGHPPVIAEDTLAGKEYIVPTYSEYKRLKYSSHVQLLLSDTEFFCTPQEADLHGYTPYPPPPP